MDSAKHYNVVIIGAGPAGAGAAVALSKRGVNSIAIIERGDKIGGIPSLYKKKKRGVRTFMRWSKGGIPTFGSEYANWLEEQLLKTSAQIKLQSQVLSIDAGKKMITYVNSAEGKMNMTSDAIIMACGSREKNQAERGWLAGSRPAKVFFTKQLLILLDERNILPFKNPVIIGSDLIAYAVAAKLENAGTSNVTIIDRYSSPQCSFFERLYFRVWSNPNYQSTISKSITIVGNKMASGVEVNGKTIPCDGIVICGELIPNSELALQGNLKVDIHSRVPVVANGCELSEPGWFIAGNILGGFHGAEWCYFNGAKVGKQVIKFINK